VQPNQPRALAFDYSGTYLAVGANDVRIYAGKQFTHVTTLDKHTAQVTGLRWLKDAQGLLSTSMDRSLKVWARK